MFQEFDKTLSSIQLTLQNSHLHLINLLYFCFKQGLFPIPGSSSIVRNIGSDLLSRRDISIKLLSCNILKMFCLNSSLFLVNSKLLRSYSRLMVAPDELIWFG